MLYPAEPDFHVVALLDYNRMLDIQHLMPGVPLPLPVAYCSDSTWMESIVIFPASAAAL